ncbi:hypothetical protein SAMN05216359_109118 [Roseateles sp. YR242]|uniref:hypothetical protein n=1 Tax=Roseateles sp. YR242 TaxID=1855305 RepID=UPI0008B6120F|nr:hypothetical protein [Roseateles sp. YR242]SEL45103.1 hypothetical protein SAMN05216359_109118 [Roseateles sp. YR242]
MSHRHDLHVQPVRSEQILQTSRQCQPLRLHSVVRSLRLRSVDPRSVGLRNAGMGGLMSLLATAGWAAGGHHAVDDAALLDPGQCQVEVWQERSDAGTFWLNHVGPACRWGGLEWGVNLDTLHQADESPQTYFGPQLKWAVPLSERVSVGVAAASNWNSRDIRYAGSTVVVPVTWQAATTVALHLNLGVDQHPGAGSRARRGLAAEWSPSMRWSLVAERFDDHGERRWRAGARYLVSDQVSLDLSRAAHLGPDTRPWWALGINWAFSPGAR